MKKSIAFICSALACAAFSVPAAYAQEKGPKPLLKCPPSEVVKGGGCPHLSSGVPVVLRPFATIDKGHLVVRRIQGDSVRVNLELMAQIDDGWVSENQRFVGFGYTSYEAEGYVVIDRAGAGQELATGSKPVFSPDKRYFAAFQMSEAGWGNREGIAVWEISDTVALPRFELNGGIANGIDARIDGWVGKDQVRLSYIDESVLASAGINESNKSKLIRHHFMLARQATGWWKLTDCAVQTACKMEGGSSLSFAKEFSGKIRGNDFLRHSFAAKAGQTISVSGKLAGTAYFNIMPPSGQPGDQLYIGAESRDGESWQGKAPVDGNYVIEVYQRGKAKDEGLTSSYRITVTVN